jgi:hypothetical protein
MVVICALVSGGTREKGDTANLVRKSAVGCVTLTRWVNTQRRNGGMPKHEWRPMLCEDARNFQLACEKSAKIREESKECKARSACESGIRPEKINVTNKKAHLVPETAVV